MHCRISKKEDLIIVADFGIHTFCGTFAERENDMIPSGKLQLGWSPSSSLLQLTETYEADEMYGKNYGYRSGLNNAMVEHLKNKVLMLTDMMHNRQGLRVLDIGSNDGTLLSFYPKTYERYGIDPTIAKFGKYYEESICKIPSFFSAELYLDKTGQKKADIVTSISMFYDLPDPCRFVEDIRSILADDGIWNLEQSYMPSMLRTNSYDTVCHEHIEYYSLYVIKQLVESHHMKIIDVSFNKINGGSFSVIVAHELSEYKPNTSIINWMLEVERRIGIHTPEPFRRFEDNAYKHRQDLLDLINALNGDGSKVAGYGASTKGNVILQFCGLTGKDIVGIAEINEDKFGKYTPGSNIPIVSEQEIKKESPEYMLVLPWHFRENIINKERDYLAKGGKLIFPLPEIEIVSS